jgi:CheY-like chemotaxis protein
MNKIYILVIEDEPAVLEAVVRDLQPLESMFPIETCSSVNEAEEVVKQIRAKGDGVGVVVCDHIMPGTTGVEFLVRSHKSGSLSKSKKVLLTGQAGLQDTIMAINEAGLDYYIAKPWKAEELRKIARIQMSMYILENVKGNPVKYYGAMDPNVLSDYLRNQGMPGGS